MRQTLTWNCTKILFSLWRMDSIFISNFALFNFLRVFYILILDDGRIWAETRCNLSFNNWQYLRLIDGLYTSITSLWTAELVCFFLYYNICRRDLLSVTYCPEKLCIAIYSHQSKHHEIHVRLTITLETVNVSLFSPWRLMGEWRCWSIDY